MDRRLKERLTGASILVLIAVLFIPELLSGPAKHAAAPMAMAPKEVPTNAAATVRTYTVDLNHPPSEASAIAAPASVAAAASAERSAPASALETPPARPQVQTLPAAAPHEAPVERPAETPTPADVGAKDTFSPIGAKGGWSIQLGSFGNRANADKLVRSMRNKGIRVYVSSQGGKHRVRAGPFPDRATAERMGTRLKSQGQTYTIVAP